MKQEEIYVEHPNGYSGRLYGISSMAIYKDGKEVLHTGFRAINTKEKLYAWLAEMPLFMELVKEE